MAAGESCREEARSFRPTHQMTEAATGLALHCDPCSFPQAPHSYLPPALASTVSHNLSDCLSGCLSHCLSHCLSNYLSRCLSHCLSHCLSRHLPDCLSHCLSHCLSLCVCRPIHPIPCTCTDAVAALTVDPRGATAQDIAALHKAVQTTSVSVHGSVHAVVGIP